MYSDSESERGSVGEGTEEEEAAVLNDSNDKTIEMSKDGSCRRRCKQKQQSQPLSGFASDNEYIITYVLVHILNCIARESASKVLLLRGAARRSHARGTVSAVSAARSVLELAASRSLCRTT